MRRRRLIIHVAEELVPVLAELADEQHRTVIEQAAWMLEVKLTKVAVERAALDEDDTPPPRSLGSLRNEPLNYQP